MKFKNYFQILVLLFLVTGATAQELTITGNVSDTEGMPLPGVNVFIEGTAIGTLTDFDGNYEIQASQGDVLVFSYIGMETVEISVADATEINVTLNPSESVLEEVIVTAAGIEREQSSMGSATTTVNSEEINRGSQANIADALKGKVAGVTISAASTDPGASSGVIIRGISSMSGSNQPLYVVDGVPINNESTFSNSLNGAYDFGRGSQDINPENIETVSILKGASATSLYGSRAANGVVIITTKTGQAGKMIVDVSSSAFYSRISRTPKYQETFGQGWDG